MAKSRKEILEGVSEMQETQDESRCSVTIAAPNLRIVKIPIRGTAPYVQHRFSEKSTIMTKRATGGNARGKSKTAIDYDAKWHAAMHISDDGWAGIPCSAFRNALIRACSLVGFKMTVGKSCVFVVGEGLDAEDSIPLTRLYSDAEPIKYSSHVRINNGQSTDVCVRPMWRTWRANLVIRFDADQMSETDIANLVQRAGIQVGVGEGRPSSKSSCGCGWGTFEIDTEV